MDIDNFFLAILGGLVVGTTLKLSDFFVMTIPDKNLAFALGIIFPFFLFLVFAIVLLKRIKK